MVGKAFIFSSLLGVAGVFTAPAYAALTHDFAVPSPFQAQAEQSPAKSVQVQLAQRRELEVYYDQYGRRVLVDPETGQVVTVLPDRSRHDGYAPRWRDRYPDDGYGQNRYDDGYNDGYAAQDDGGRIIEYVEGSFSNVVGLPIERTLVALARHFA